MTLQTIDKKSTLAKLLATENIEVQQNNVRTASFDVKNRILTIPIFKHENKDVLDMLIAHECSHALWTGLEDWKSICEESEEYKAYCNVLEDCRIDRMIQKKYPGIVKNYVNGYKELMRIDFFGVSNQNLNTLNLIDRINLYYKSSKSADIIFDDANWVLDEIDNLKTLDDVKVLARKLLEQEKEKQQTKNTDDHSQEENQGDGDSNKSDNPNDEGETSYDNKDNNNTSDDADDDNNEESNEDTTSGESGTTNSVSAKKPENVADNTQKSAEPTEDNNILPKTSKNAENNSGKVTYNGNSFLKYFSLPDVDLKTAIVSNSKFRKDHIEHIKRVTTQEYSACEYMTYYKWLKDDFKKFKNDNLKTVNYLVKEFEMKKSATAYKRSSTDKTGIIDPLKLKNYKFSDDIFKRLSICPDEKNHGFIFLLDWSGSMYDNLSQTIDQLINLIYFAKKINVPFEVYAFTEMNSGRYDVGEKKPQPYNYKTGDLVMRSNIRLINLASHKLKKKELDDSMIALWLNRCYYKFSSRQRWYGKGPDGYTIPCASDYELSSTPLNEGLVVLNKLIPMFKNKYSIEKMSLVTLTDGYSNSMSRDIHNREYKDWTRGWKPGDIMVPIIKDGNKNYTLKKYKRGYGNSHYSSRDYTGLFILMLKQKFNMTAVGFHIMKNYRYGASEYIKDTDNSEFTKQLRKGFFTAEIKNGYDEFWILNSKKLSVESNNNIDDIKEDMKPGQIKRLFAGGLKSKLQSRIVLNKFIERVA